MIEPIKIGNKKYLTVNTMAAITNKSTQTVYWLIKKGNTIRKMKAIRIADRWLIPFEELINFPFTSCGPNSKDTIYHYNEKGKIVEDSNGG